MPGRACSVCMKTLDCQGTALRRPYRPPTGPCMKTLWALSRSGRALHHPLSVHDDLGTLWACPLPLLVHRCLLHTAHVAARVQACRSVRCWAFSRQGRLLGVARMHVCAHCQECSVGGSAPHGEAGCSVSRVRKNEELRIGSFTSCGRQGGVLGSVHAKGVLQPEGMLPKRRGTRCYAVH